MPFTSAFFSKCDKSAATPAGGTIATLRSKTHNSFTAGFIAINIERGCPIPPAPPQTHTLNIFAGAFGFTGLALVLDLALAFVFAFAFGSGSFAAFVFAFAFAFVFAFSFFATLQDSQ